MASPWYEINKYLLSCIILKYPDICIWGCTCYSRSQNIQIVGNNESKDMEWTWKYWVGISDHSWPYFFFKSVAFSPLGGEWWRGQESVWPTSHCLWYYSMLIILIPQYQMVLSTSQIFICISEGLSWIWVTTLYSLISSISESQVIPKSEPHPSTPLALQIVSYCFLSKVWALRHRHHAFTAFTWSTASQCGSLRPLDWQPCLKMDVVCPP